MHSSTLNIVCVIPARLNSTRFPQKILAPIEGTPMMIHTWKQAIRCKKFSRVLIAVDDEKTLSLAQLFGAEAIMTSPSIPSGTLRIASLFEQTNIDAEIVVGWQADEPFLKQEMIDDLLSSLPHDTADVWTLKKTIPKEEALSSHVVKVVTNKENLALYFSRSLIPFYREKEPSELYEKHIGIYAYRKQTLRIIQNLPMSYLEKAEKLEQLSFLYGGLNIRVHTTMHDSFGVDLPEDLL